MVSILVTGSTGYLGSVLTEVLLEQNFDVSCIDKGIFGFEAAERVKGRVDFQKRGFEDFEVSELKKFDAICHLAAFSNDPSEGFSVAGNQKINCDYAVDFARKCAEAQVQKFIFASSASVYGFEDKCGEITEDHEPSPSGYYGKSKLNAEIGMWKYKDDMDLIILRQGTLMGCSPRQRYDIAVNAFIKSAFQDGVIHVHGGGEVWRPFVNVLDVAEAYVKIIKNQDIESDIYNLVHKNYRISELAHYIVHCIEMTDSSFRGNIQVNFDYGMEKDTRSYQLSGEKIKKNLDIIPHIGILETVQVFMKNFELGNDVDFDNPKYYNIKWIKLGMHFTKMLKDNPNVFYEFTEAES